MKDQGIITLQSIILSQMIHQRSKIWGIKWYILIREHLQSTKKKKTLRKSIATQKTDRNIIREGTAWIHDLVLQEDMEWSLILIIRSIKNEREVGQKEKVTLKTNQETTQASFNRLHQTHQRKTQIISFTHQSIIHQLVQEDPLQNQTPSQISVDKWEIQKIK